MLQGLHYYGLSDKKFIDKDPMFLIAVDKGIFFLYGAAKVYKRVWFARVCFLKSSLSAFSMWGTLAESYSVA